jgi:sec-independent protein translocase protein TatB
MFDLGMSELLVIGIVALIVIGPKDLPGLFRSLGRFTAKMRNMAREFSRAMEAAADETGVKDVAKDLKDATSAKSMGLDKVREAADRFEKWDPMKSVTKPAAAAATVVAAAPAAGTTAASSSAEDKPRGPATAALAEAQAARKAAAQEAAEKLRRTAAPVAEAAAPAAPPEPPKAEA